MLAGRMSHPLPTDMVPTDDQHGSIGESTILHLLGLRLLAALLTGLWTGLAATILVAYRPGGPFDLVVGAAGFVPAVISAVAVVWPPLARSWRAVAAIAWLGILSALLVAPLMIGVINTLATGGHQLFPSPEVTYAALLALGTTALFGALGIVRARYGNVEAAPSLRRAVGLAAALTLAGVSAVGGPVLANELALRSLPLADSRFGPTDPSLVPPHCESGMALGSTAETEVTAQAMVDGTSVGSATLSGVRSGSDEEWTATLDGRYARGIAAFRRVGGTAWLEQDAASWAPVDVASFGQLGDGPTLEGPIPAAALGPTGQPVAEDLGTELIEGARARHCQTAIDGPTALRASLAIRWLAEGDLRVLAHSLTAWRGELDWWVFSDGQLGQAIVTINGYPGDAWPSAGLQASITARLTATDRGMPQDVGPPPVGEGTAPGVLAPSAAGGSTP